MASRAFDTFLTYRIISTLVTDWKDQPAFEHGIIDEKGKLLKKSNTLKTKDEKDSYTLFHRLVFNLKRLFNRYKEDGVLKERLILNHIISFYNVFENEAATRLLFFRVGKEYYSLLKTFLVFLNKMPEQINDNLYSSDIQLDDKITEILRNLK